MKTLELHQMEQIEGGMEKCSNGVKAGLHASETLVCMAATIWPIGTAIAGPSCVGLLMASTACTAKG